MKIGTPMGALHPQYIVGIGGSAGALPAYKAFLDALPTDTDLAYVIICHMTPSANSELAIILSRHTKMPITLISDKMPILRNHVYVIPSDSDLFIKNFTFQVLHPRARGQNQIDLFFTSLAEAMGARAIGIVLSGYLDDGTGGCKQIKAKGGITFAQDMSAEIEQMPLSVQGWNSIDFVLHPGKIPDKLIQVVASRYAEKKNKRI